MTPKSPDQNNFCSARSLQLSSFLKYKDANNRQSRAKLVFQRTSHIVRSFPRSPLMWGKQSVHKWSLTSRLMWNQPLCCHLVKSITEAAKNSSKEWFPTKISHSLLYRTLWAAFKRSRTPCSSSSSARQQSHLFQGKVPQGKVLQGKVSQDSR